MDGDPARAGEPTLSDDERRLGELSAELLDGVLAAIPGWIERVVAERSETATRTLPPEHRRRIDRASAALTRLLEGPLQTVLLADVDAGAGSPLAVLRANNGPLNALLDELAVPRPARDPFEAERFPDDHHGVGPASFTDIDPALHDRSLVWGAARAHVHLRRRREERGAERP